MSATANMTAGRNPVNTNRKQTLLIFASIGRLHITVIAALGAFTFGWLFTGDYPWLITAVCAMDWYIVNLFNRIVDLEEDRTNAIPGNKCHFIGHIRHLQS